MLVLLLLFRINGSTNSRGLCSQCTVEVGYLCQHGETCEAVCGDGIHTLRAEGCDDGNRVSGDGCSDTCSVEYSTEDLL